ncbi:hypothetical protein An11g08000 [Aspergillus niger]|uniref:Uncharacterized protein n=2 Tax=Aspergillus niger TaxID=5061 RepID=A2QX85_ASPNC|nr:hypothetical protein An11g08000 [Aspergillus niger]CAK45993.1 hypothetical protein An11g08000 [Aspergillus niger]
MPHARLDYRLQATATLDTDGAAAPAVQDIGDPDPWWVHTAWPDCDRSGGLCTRPRVVGGELWPNNLGYPRLTMCTGDEFLVATAYSTHMGGTMRLTGNYLDYRAPKVGGSGLNTETGGGEMTANKRTRARVREKGPTKEPSNAEVEEKQMGEERKTAEAFRVGFLSRSHWVPHLQPEVCTGRAPQATLFAFCRIL